MGTNSRYYNPSRKFFQDRGGDLGGGKLERKKLLNRSTEIGETYHWAVRFNSCKQGIVDWRMVKGPGIGPHERLPVNGGKLRGMVGYKRGEVSKQLSAEVWLSTFMAKKKPLAWGANRESRSAEMARGRDPKSPVVSNVLG